jgi:N-acetyl-gamma-glutamyl-phosphate reductase
VNSIRVGIAGATGYTGSELVRILRHHPYVHLEVITSENRTGERFSSVHPAFHGIEDRTLEPISEMAKRDLDLVFLALPNGAAMDFLRDYGVERFRIVDLSGDFRLRSAAVYEEWYRKTHVAPEYLTEAVYGLPEWYRSRISGARLVANPGCYPTSAILALAPLLCSGLIQPTGIVVDSQSGVTGAGATPRPATHFPDVFGNFRAYGLLRHRHTPEMEQALSDTAGLAAQLLFTPHLLPIDRGILTTAYAQTVDGVDAAALHDAYKKYYGDEYFIRMVDSPPAVKYVRGSNYCDIYAAHDIRTNQVVVLSAIDNLVKGAAGQAVQNMNIMFAFPETTALDQCPLSP